jgi:hypothetical protein
VAEMAWDVGEREVGGADELHGGALEHRVVLLADEARVFDRLFDDVVDVLCAVRRCVRKGGGQRTALVQMIPT